MPKYECIIAPAEDRGLSKSIDWEF